jgi:RNA polymerase sigma factor (sigma-70 family)
VRHTYSAALKIDTEVVLPQALDAEQLLSACQSSDERLRADAFQRLGQLLYRVLLREVGGGDPRVAHLAEDCAQEAIVAIWQRLESGHGPDHPASFVGWSARIAVNKLRDAQRRLEPQARVRRSKRVGLSRQVRLDAPEGEEGRAMSERLADDGTHESDAALGTEELRELLFGIRDLGIVSESSKTVLLRGYLGGWDDLELADSLRTTKNNVHVIRCRDLAKLRGDPGFMRRLHDGLGDSP